MSKWFSSKTILGGLLLVVLGVVQIRRGDTSGGLELLGEGVAAIGLRHAVWKASPPK